MDNSREILDLLRQINNGIQFLVASVPDFSEIENLLVAILEELQRQ